MFLEGREIEEEPEPLSPGDEGIERRFAMARASGVVATVHRV